MPTLTSRAVATAIALSLLVPAASGAQDDTDSSAEPEADSEGGSGSESEGDSENPDASEESDLRWSGFPIIAYSPETNLLLGGVLVLNFWHGDSDDDEVADRDQSSSVTVAAAASLKRLFFVGLNPSLYFDRETWRLWGGVGFEHFPQTFWGVGNDTDTADKENFTERRFELAAFGTRRVVSRLSAGVGIWARHREFTKIESGGAIDTEMVPGTQGGRELGLGPIVAWDNRDNDFATRSGGRYELTLAIVDRVFGSEYDYTWIVADARHFFHLPWDHVIGLQALGDFRNGSPPFQSLSLIGGSNIMRGSFEGRLRDKHTMQFQAEYRLPVYWRFGAAAFVAVGQAFPKVTEISFDRLNYAAGGGIRFALDQDEHIHLRLDVAYATTDETNVYFTLGEAF